MSTSSGYVNLSATGGRCDAGGEHAKQSREDRGTDGVESESRVRRAEAAKKQRFSINNTVGCSSGAYASVTRLITM